MKNEELLSDDDSNETVKDNIMQRPADEAIELIKQNNVTKDISKIHINIESQCKTSHTKTKPNEYTKKINMEAKARRELTTIRNHKEIEKVTIQLYDCQYNKSGQNDVLHSLENSCYPQSKFDRDGLFF